MNWLRPAMTVFLILAISLIAQAQDTLPSFSVINRGGKIIVSWVNPFDSLVQLSVQRSPDSLKGFKTVVTIPNPKAPVNGFWDQKAPDAKQYYKIYVQMEGGKFFFTRVRQASIDSAKKVTYQLVKNDLSGIRFSKAGELPDDTARIILLPQIKLFTPSVFVFTNPGGHVTLALPAEKSKVFSIRFNQSDGTPVFSMKNIKESQLTLDKSNFQRSGWFEFELYENDDLKEKGKVFIPKDRQ